MEQKINITERIDLIKVALGFKQAQSNQSLLTMARRFTPAYGEPPRRSSQDWLEFYHKNPRLAVPIHQIASDVGTATYGIYRKNDSKKIKLQNTELERLFNKPNSDKTISQYILFYTTAVSLLLPIGEAYWILERNSLDKVTEIWPCPAHWVMEIPSIARPFFSVFPQGNMQSPIIRVRPEDMVYFKAPNVENPYLRGMGRSDAIGDEAETDEWMSKWQKRFFFNDAVPPIVGQMPNADEATINRTEEMWQQKFGGYNNSHKVAFINWEAKFEHLRDSTKEMDFVNARQFLADATRQFFSIPPEMFGDVKNSNRSTIESSYFLYSKNILRKELSFLTDVINRQLVPEFSNDMFFQFDEVVPEDKEFELKKTSEGLKNGGILVDEWRLKNGWDALPNGRGQILYTPLNMIPTMMDGTQLISEPQKAYFKALIKEPEPLPPEPQPPPEKTIKALTPEHKNQLWNVLDKAAIKNERGFINALKKYFQAQQDKVNKSLEKSVKAATDDPDELLDWDEEDAALVAALTVYWIASLKEGYEAVNETFGFGISFDVMNPRFLKWVKNNGLERAKGINDTTKGKLQKTLSEGIADGESVPKLRDRISTVFTEAKTTRATLIARTETHNTVGVGTHETYKVANLKQSEWKTTIDGRERDSHAAMDGEVKDIDEPFSNGLMHPGDPSGPPEEVCNCRCVELPVLPE